MTKMPLCFQFGNVVRYSLMYLIHTGNLINLHLITEYYWTQSTFAQSILSSLFVNLREDVPVANSTWQKTRHVCKCTSSKKNNRKQEATIPAQHNKGKTFHTVKNCYPVNFLVTRQTVGRQFQLGILSRLTVQTINSLREWHTIFVQHRHVALPQTNTQASNYMYKNSTKYQTGLYTLYMYIVEMVKGDLKENL